MAAAMQGAQADVQPRNDTEKHAAQRLIWVDAAVKIASDCGTVSQVYSRPAGACGTMAAVSFPAVRAAFSSERYGLAARIRVKNPSGDIFPYGNFYIGVIVPRAATTRRPFNASPNPRRTSSSSLRKTRVGR